MIRLLTHILRSVIIMEKNMRRRIKSQSATINYKVVEQKLSIDCSRWRRCDKEKNNT